MTNPNPTSTSTLTPTEPTTEAHDAASSASTTATTSGPPLEDAPAGVVVGPDGQRAVFMSESEYFDAGSEENHGLPIAVAGIGAAVVALVPAVAAMGENGVAGAIGAVFGAGVALVFAMLLNTGVGWVVGKICMIDYGTLPSMLLRFAAFTAAYVAAFTIMSMALGSLFAMFFCLPVMLGLAIWLLAMDMFQALVYTAVLAIGNWLLGALMMMTFASMVF